jgi:hypothetical protein
VADATARRRRKLALQLGKCSEKCGARPAGLRFLMQPEEALDTIDINARIAGKFLDYQKISIALAQPPSNRRNAYIIIASITPIMELAASNRNNPATVAVCSMNL